MILSTDKRELKLVMDLIKHFWYLIHVERQIEAVSAQMSQMTPLKTVERRTLLLNKQLIYIRCEAG